MEKRVLKYRLKKKHEKKDKRIMRCAVKKDRIKEILHSAYYNGFLDKYLAENEEPKDLIDKITLQVSYMHYVVTYNAYDYTPKQIKRLFMEKVDYNMICGLLFEKAERLRSIGELERFIQIGEYLFTILYYLEILNGYDIGLEYTSATLRARLIVLKQSSKKFSDFTDASRENYLRNAPETLVLSDSNILEKHYNDIDDTKAIKKYAVMVEAGGSNRYVKMPVRAYEKLKNISYLRFEIYYMDAKTHALMMDTEYIVPYSKHYTKMVKEYTAPLILEYDSEQEEQNSISQLLSVVMHYISMTEGLDKVTGQKLDTGIIADELVRIKTSDGVEVETYTSEVLSDYFGFLA